MRNGCNTATLLLALILILPGFGLAQDFPSKPVRIVVPNPPGTHHDILARAMGPEMTKTLGQPVVVENKPGAAQLLGSEHVARQSPADGYTLLIANVSTLAIFPLTVKDLRFDSLKELPPVIRLGLGRYVFGSAATLPWKSFNELFAHAKANPGKLNYGTSSMIGRLYIEALTRESNVNLVHIPYNAGSAFLQGLGSAEVHMGFIGEPAAVAYGDKFRVLAVTGETRAATFPASPTFTELGYPQIRGLGYSLNVRAGTPRPIVDRLYAAASKPLQQADMKALFVKLQLDLDEQGPDAAAKGLAEEGRVYAEIAKKAGIQPE